MEELFRELDGVLDTEVGYAGGSPPVGGESPTYENHPGHAPTLNGAWQAEALENTYDPERISYQQLLDFFFRIHNPTTKNRQGNDVGSFLIIRIRIYLKSLKVRCKLFAFLVSKWHPLFVHLTQPRPIGVISWA